MFPFYTFILGACFSFLIGSYLVYFKDIKEIERNIEKLRLRLEKRQKQREEQCLK